MDEWLDTEPRGLTDDQLAARLVECQAVRARFEAAELATIREWDSRQAWAADGAQTGGAWLKGHTGMAGSTAREKVRVARTLGEMPVTEAAFAAGEISYGKVRVLAKAINDRTRARFLADEEMLVGYARQFGTDELERLIAHWLSCVDADGASDDAMERWEQRGAAMAEVNGTGHLHATFDPESSSVFSTELEALMREAYEADRADLLNGITMQMRTAQQRRLDSLVEMARRSRACDLSKAHRSRPEIIVMADYDTYLNQNGTAETARGGRLSGKAVQRLACEAGIVRAVAAGQSELLDLGRSTPVPNRAQRRAAALKWSSCMWPGCDRPIHWSDLHHLEPYRRGRPTGGNTDNDDLVPNCPHHHHLLHEKGYKAIRNLDTGQIELRRPDGTLIAIVEPDGPITRRRTGQLVHA